jgi:hypothetical protein
MKIIGANVTGSFILNGVDVTNTLQSSSIWSGSVASSINSLNSATASLNASTASLYNYTSSNTTNINTLFTASSSLNASVTSLNAATASLNTATASFSSSIGSLNNATASLNTATSSLNSSITSLNAATASLLSYTASQTALNGTFATTGSNTFVGTQTLSGSLLTSGSITATGTITAQTLVVQTITSSVDFVTGSTRFGSISANTHVFTGSVSVTGSITANSLTGSINGSQITDATVSNAKLTNSTISGIALGSNLATLTIGTGLSGTSYNGSTGITIANTITNNNQLTNGAGYITSTGTAAAINQTITAGSEGNLVFATIGTNDFFRIRAGGGSNAGFVEIATADDGTEPIYVRQYTGEFASLTRTATLLDGSGNTSFPGSLSATNLSGTNTGDQTNISGNSATTSQTTFSTLTSTGAITANSGGSYSATLGTIASSWGGNSTYPTLYGSTVDRWVMHMNMHISYTANGVNGFGGSMTGATIRMASDTAATHYWDIGPGTSGVGTDKFSIGRNATSFFTITSGGIVGINTTSPLNTAWGNDSVTKQLSMYGSGYAVINLEGANGGTTRKFSMGVGDSRFYMCYDNTAARHNLTINSDGLATFGGAITAVGDITAFSDFRLKENVLTITNPLSKVMNLRGVSYNRTDLEDKTKKIGFIAQEVKETVPEVVTYNEEADKYGVSYGNVTALLVEAIKEQQTQIEELKSIINGLTK